jgi:hypothetical protein
LVARKLNQAGDLFKRRAVGGFVLALQLHIPFDVRLSSDGLMGASPNGPCDDVSGIDPSLRKTDGDAADFLNRPADQWR